MSRDNASIRLHRKVLEIRKSQFSVHEIIYNEGTQIPIHFAFGHEAIALAVSSSMSESDKLLLPHRNIHYHLALGASVDNLVSEYKLELSSMSGKNLGSMNLDFPRKGAIYTSNILGNNLSVATGIALGIKVKKERAATWCITGDGAIEEGSFYESLLLSSSKQLGVIFVVENNRWSLASEIAERRVDIDLKLMAQSLGAQYEKLFGNNVVEYQAKLSEIREKCVKSRSTFVVEIDLKTLGGFFVGEGDLSRYVNYHAGKAQHHSIASRVIEYSNLDPVWVSENFINNNASKDGLK